MKGLGGFYLKENVRAQGAELPNATFRNIRVLISPVAYGLLGNAQQVCKFGVGLDFQRGFC